jgi:hypothetical protein
MQILEFGDQKREAEHRIEEFPETIPESRCEGLARLNQTVLTCGSVREARSAL